MACLPRLRLTHIIPAVIIAVGFLSYRLLEPPAVTEDQSHTVVADSEIATSDPVSVTATRDPGLPSPSTDDLVNSGETDRLGHRVVVSGTVETDRGEIATGETVVFYSPSLDQRYSMRSSVHGEFSFTNIRPAMDYRLTVSPRGMYKRYRQAPLDLSSDQVLVNVTLRTLASGVLRGTVVDTYGRPVSQLEMSLRSGEKEFWSVDTLTDASGHFSVAGFPQGLFQVTAWREQSFKATGLSFDPAFEMPVTLTLDLGPYTLSGRIYDQSGQTFSGAHVVVTWTRQDQGVESRSTRQITADGSGVFRFTGLGAGAHELVVSAWEGGSFRQTVKQTVTLGVDPGELNIILNAF